MNKKGVENHILHLKEKHDALNKEINLLEEHGNYKHADLQMLKRRKLYFKDQISVFEEKLKGLT
jgi:hypothetical protein